MTSPATRFPDFPRVFDPPADVARRLREEDPAVELLYMGWGRWYLVRFNPRRFAIEQACRRLPTALRLLRDWEVGTKYKANPGAFKRLYGRYLYWTMVRLGAQPIAEYTARQLRRIGGFSGVVDDFRQMQYLYRTLSDSEVLDALNADATAKENAPDPLADPYLHRDTARYLFTRTHAATRHDNPERTPVRSGFTRVATADRTGASRN